MAISYPESIAIVHGAPQGIGGTTDSLFWGFSMEKLPQASKQRDW
jgi:hypothetical protein